MFRIFVSEIYEIQDCTVANDCTTNSIENVFSVPSALKNSTYGFSSDGWKFGNAGGWTDVPMAISYPTLPFEVAFKITELSYQGLTLNLGKNGNTWKSFISNNPQNIIFCGTNIGAVSYNSDYAIKVYSDKIELYCDGTLITTHNTGLTTVQLMWGTGQDRIIRVKDFKIKPL